MCSCVSYYYFCCLSAVRYLEMRGLCLPTENSSLLPQAPSPPYLTYATILAIEITIAGISWALSLRALLARLHCMSPLQQHLPKSPLYMGMGTLCTAKKPPIHEHGDTLQCQKARYIWAWGHFALPKSPCGSILYAIRKLLPLT